MQSHSPAPAIPFIAKKGYNFDASLVHLFNKRRLKATRQLQISVTRQVKIARRNHIQRALRSIYLIDIRLWSAKENIRHIKFARRIRMSDLPLPGRNKKSRSQAGKQQS